MMDFQTIPHLTVCSGLEFNLISGRMEQSQKNVSVHFNLSQENVSAYLLLDSYDHGHSERMELLEVLSETMNIYLGKILSLEESKQELSPPHFLNLDQAISFNNRDWNFFELLFNETIYTVAIRGPYDHVRN